MPEPRRVLRAEQLVLPGRSHDLPDDDGIAGALPDRARASFGTGSASSSPCRSCATDGTATTYPYADQAALQQRQEWSFDDSGKFEGRRQQRKPQRQLHLSRTRTTTRSSAASSTSRAAAAAASTPRRGTRTRRSAPGRPATTTQSLVNYSEFGRCLDVTGQNVNATWLIDYPCKQAPDPSNIAWNQRWTYTTSATATTRSPRRPAASPTASPARPRSRRQPIEQPRPDQALLQQRSRPRSGPKKGEVSGEATRRRTRSSATRWLVPVARSPGLLGDPPTTSSGPPSSPRRATVR